MRSDEELKQFGYRKANSKLSDEEFSRWQELQKQDMKKSAQENRKKWRKQHQKALDSLVNTDESEVAETIEHQGNEIKYLFNLNREQERIVKEMKRLESKSEYGEEDESRYEQLVIDLFDDIIIEFNSTRISDADFSGEELAKYLIDEWGKLVFQELIQDIVLDYYEGKREKMEAIEKFRG